jgi:hypothetical protein
MVGVVLAIVGCGRLSLPERRSPLDDLPDACEAPEGGLAGWEGVSRPEMTFFLPANMIRAWPVNSYDMVYGRSGRTIGMELTTRFIPVRPPTNALYKECTAELSGRLVEMFTYTDLDNPVARYAIDARWRDVYDGRDLVVHIRARNREALEELRRVLFTFVFPDERRS